ncbi:triacylglycerol lipase 3 [Coprinopsis marcescibilis]|uniref:Carboxylic ester hydrolase n=1 Tax=Coprinopsis marcescibilis TaxID=230819 RepID=A0A5C3KY17_COPMA|nr:triacylglycerol lipase 3 [Coprinopsis marcescibilis]
MVYKAAVLLFGLFVGAFAAPEIKLHGTTLIGRDVTTSNVEFFGGIPFAEPPVGRLRFRPPVLKTRLDTPTFDASEYGDWCLQPPLTPGIKDVSEDCLTINVHRPTGAKPGDKLPVLFWVYGGAFLIGGAGFYNGSGIVAHSIQRDTPIVYVNFNYRLGPFGYPQGKEAEDRSQLNLALQDISTALKWVHANIHVFGGDKSKITIFGESAGAMNIGVLLLNQEFERLVRGAIFESGQANGSGVFRADRGELTWQGFVRSIPSCASLAITGNTFPCLQNASQEEISAAYLGSFNTDQLTVAWQPTLDPSRGSLLPYFPSKLYKKGKFARIPFIAGTNLDEGTSFSAVARNENYTESDIRAEILATSSPLAVDPGHFAEVTDRLLELYPDSPALGSPYGTGEELFGLPSLYKRVSSILGDLIFEGPRRQWTQAAAEHGVKVYGYLFTQPQPFGQPESGVPHAAEIGYVYGNAFDAGESGRRLTTTMMDYWISFAVNLDPNDDKGSKRPIWPVYTKPNQVLIQLNGDNTTVIRDDYREARIGHINDNSIAFRR